MIPGIIGRVRAGSAVSLNEGGRPRMNPIYIDDAVAAILAALEVDGHKIVNVAGDEIVTIREIAEAAGPRGGRRAGLRGRRRHGRRRRDRRHDGVPRVARRPCVRARSTEGVARTAAAMEGLAAMCGIAAMLDRSDRWVEQPELLRMTDSMRHRGPGRRGLVRRSRRRPRQPPARDHRPHCGRAPADVQRGRLGLDHLQRHALQLPRAAPSSSSPPGTTSARRATPRSSSTPTRSGATTASLRFDGMFAFAIWDAAEAPDHGRARPLRRQAAVLDRARRAPRARLRAQGRARGRRAAARRRRRRSSSTSRSRTCSPIARSSRACTRCPAGSLIVGRRRRREGAALVGLRVRSRRLALAGVVGRRGARRARGGRRPPADGRRPGRQLSLRRPRLRLARGARVAARAAADDVHGRLRPDLRRGPRARVRRARIGRVALEPVPHRALRDGHARGRHGLRAARPDLAPRGSARRHVLPELLHRPPGLEVRQGLALRRRRRRALRRLSVALREGSPTCTA